MEGAILMNLWDIDVWSLMVTLTILLGGMLFGNALRRTIKPLRQSLIPSAILGGFIVLLSDSLLKKVFDIHMFGADTYTLEVLTYHGLGLGVAAITLKDGDVDKAEKKRERSTVFNYGVMVVTTYLMQGIIGLLITIGLFFTVLKTYPAAGLILPMGWGQGPGEAYAWGQNYETLGFAKGTSFGLTVAAMGFIAASMGGIFYLARLKKKGLAKTFENSEEMEDLSAELVTKKGEIPLSESMDKLTVQIALVAIAYTMAYMLMMGFNLVIDTGILGHFGVNTLQPLIWGFNFLFATFTALLLKMILRKLKKANVIKREYKNDFLQSRFSGFMFDIMVVASIAAIDLSAFRERSFIIPLIVMFIFGIVSTYWYCDFVCKNVFPTLRHESFLALYGILAATNSMGFILLREIDPNFKTPVARYVIYQVVYASMFGFPLMMLMGYAPNNATESATASIITVAILVVFFSAMNLLLFRSHIFKKKQV